MKVFLMFENDDFTVRKKSPPNGSALKQDLELNTLCNAMASGDEFVSKMAMDVVLSGLYNDEKTILYRQDILKDSLENPIVVRDIYKIAVEALESRNRHWWFLSTSPTSVLYSSLSSMKELMGFLKQLKIIADENTTKFKSEGFIRFFAMLKKELDDEYFAKVINQLWELEFHNGVLISAELGKGNKGSHYTLRKQVNEKLSWMQRILNKKPQGYSFVISSRDESGIRALSELKSEGINHVANALAQSMEHILSFFNMLRTEVAFYIGCLNLYEQLIQMGEPTSFPVPLSLDKRIHSFEGLYDVCLALTMKQKIVGNNLAADNKNLVIITGANKGGKSTFLRGIGLSQLMMQCGMFVPADSFSVNICDALFTHFKREEDSGMNSGKLDEELSRMSDIADTITSNSIILFNESFAATNEREGSEIGRQIVNALLEKRIKVFFVTHLYDFAHSYFNGKMENATFLRAERQTDGTRTFKLTEGEPLQTSYGKDLYNKIFEGA
jgi:DNA mismatch repair ATPase MutS